MKKLIIIIISLIVIIIAGLLAHWFPLSRWWDGLTKWANNNSGVVALLGVVVALLGIYLSHLLKKAEQKWRDPIITTVEHNYLHQMAIHFAGLEQRPLPYSEDEIVNLQAELVEPSYRILEQDTAQRPSRSDQGKLVSNLVKVLHETEVPLVVLGDPGAGKSVSLRKVGLSFVNQGLRQSSPKLPVYVRLGTFTRQVARENAAIQFIKDYLKNFLSGQALPIVDKFDDYLNQGRVVFLLDAMDEMPRDDIQERFDALSKLHKQYAANKILFACRKLDFRESFRFQRAVIQPFDRGQVKEFLRKSLHDLSKVATREILSPSYPLREMATNPFFLKLFSVFYKERKRLPESRAELMSEYEAQVFKRAESRENFPKGLSREAFSSILARLGYLITTSRRGVTIPVEVFGARFVPSSATEGSDRLLQYKQAIQSVLDVAKTESLLIFDKEQVDDSTSEIVSFYHHRLQEYYTAVYLEKFKPAINWQEHFDDIWWQETLIMLFGIAEHPESYMDILLASLPKKPILCSDLGRRLADLFEAEDHVVGITELEKFFSLDASGFYGLKALAQTSTDTETLFNELEEIGMLPPSLKPLPKDLAALSSLSAEPDENDFCDYVRRWLEERNSTLLDRIELGAECYRNALSKLSSRSVDRLTSLLSSILKDGNMWEAVRAIQKAARLPRIDLYSVVEPALLHRDAWCRREAMSAVAKYPIGTGTNRSHTGFIIFLQFLKGELPLSLPQFYRTVRESPRFAWLIPGILFLIALSIPIALSPALVYEVLMTRYPGTRLDLTGVLGLDWSVWALGISLLICLCVYLSRLHAGIPILRATLFACAMAFFLPGIIDSAIAHKWTTDPNAPTLSLYENSVYMFEEAKFGIRFGLSCLIAVFAAQTVEIAALSIVTLISCLLMGSLRILKAITLYTKEAIRSQTYLEYTQVALALGPAFFILIALFMFILAGFAYVGSLLARRFFFISGGAILLLVLILTLRWFRQKLQSGYRAKEILQGPLENIVLLGGMGAILGALYGIIKLLSYLGVFLFLKSVLTFIWYYIKTYLGPVAAVAALLLAALVVLWVLYFLLRKLFSTLLDVINVLIVFYWRYIEPKKQAPPIRIGPSVVPRGGPGTWIWRKVEEEAMQKKLSAEERYALYRQALRYVNSVWVRSFMYREMSRIHKEIRQERPKS